LDKFTDTIATQIVSIIKSKLKPFEEQGIKVEILDTSYSNIYLETKIALHIVDKNDEAEKERKEFFEENCESIGLKPEDFGKVFKSPTIDKYYKIAGLDFHDVNPVLVKDTSDEEDVFYRMSIIDVKKVIK
jgi:hypothetical protein